MNHYPRHIGDFVSATVGLSLAERGAYSALLDRYYADELPLPLDKTECYRAAGAASAAERKAVDYVLGRYFTRADDGYHNKRADKEVAAYQERAKQARENGKHGGRPRNRQETDLVISGLPKETQTKANQEPVTSNHKSKAKTVAASPLPDWLPQDAWREFLKARVAMKARTTPEAERLLLLDLAKLREQGHDPAGVLRQSISRSWRGLFAVKPSGVVGGKQEHRNAFADAIIGATNGREAAERADPRDISGEAERVA